MNIKRQQILEKAFALFYQYGFHAVGINKIIKEANVAKRTLYHYFSSKDALIIATLDLHHQQLMQHFHHSLTLAVPGKDSILVIFEQLDAWVNQRTTALPAFKGCYFTMAHAEFSAINPEIIMICKEHKEVFQDLLKKQVDDFEQNKDKNQLLVGVLNLLKEGVLADKQVLTKSNSAAQATHYIETLLRFKR